MNEVIKQRGEKLTLLEAREEEMKAELDRVRSKTENAPLLSSAPTSADAEVQVALQPLPQHPSHQQQGLQVPGREREGGGGGDEQETASTATSEMSVKEQAARMREVDASLEEYSQKLKLLAIKQKKRIVELEGEKKALLVELDKAKSSSAVVSFVTFTTQVKIQLDWCHFFGSNVKIIC